MYKMYVFLLVIFFTTFCAAMEPVLICSQNSEVLDKLHPEWFIDTTAEMTLEDVLSEDFVEDNTVDFGVTHAALWTRLSIKGFQDDAWIFTTRFHKVDQVDFYILYEDGTIKHDVSGNFVPLRKRSIQFRRPSFNFLLHEQEEAQIYVRMISRSSMYIDFKIMTASSFFAENLVSERFLFFYFGAILIIALFNLMIFFSSHNKAYLYYFLYVVSMLLYQIAVEGYGNVFFWEQWDWFKPRSYNFAIALSFLFAVMFTRSYLDLGKNTRSLNTIGRILEYTFIATGIAIMFSIESIIISWGNICIFAGVIYIFYAGFYVLIKRFEPAKYFVIAWSTLLTGVLVTTLRRLFILPDTLLTEYALHVAHICEAVLLAFALRDRSRVLQQRVLEAEEELTEAHARILQNRMKPHFLFNSMNLVFNQLHENPEKAQTTLRKLADNFHFLTETDGVALITLREEWNFLENYLGIMEQRWPGSLTIEKFFDASLSLLPVPPLTIQPLAENAFKYGLKKLEQKYLSCVCSIQDGKVVIEVRNSSADKLGAVNFGRSLGNIQRRLRRYYPDAQINIRQEETFVIAEIFFCLPAGFI